MRGLYIKDLKLMKNQKSFFLVVGLLAIFFAVTQTNSFFVISYVTVVSSMFVISSISYDEFNNGNTFLFTLPISKKTYVREKYLLGISLSIGAWLIAVLLVGSSNIIKGTEFLMGEWLLSCAVILLIAMVMLSVIIPVQLKFGQNKGNVAMLLAMGGIFVIGYAFIKFASLMKIDIVAMVNALSTMGLAGLVGIFILIVLIISIGSYLLSCKIMYNKEF
ncbi:ABC-2 transporter permease [Thomasclavelia sp.]